MRYKKRIEFNQSLIGFPKVETSAIYDGSGNTISTPVVIQIESISYKYAKRKLISEVQKAISKFKNSKLYVRVYPEVTKDELGGKYYGYARLLFV